MYFNGLGLVPPTFRNQVCTNKDQERAYDRGYYAKEADYQKGSKNHRAYVQGQRDRQTVEDYVDKVLLPEF